MPNILAASRWLSCPRAHPTARLRLWCLPFAGGGASMWRTWDTALAPDVEVVAFRLPGRENRLAEAPITEPTKLVGQLFAELEPYAEGDFILCGHSLGGLLAFALMGELARRDRPLPRGLIVSGVRAPHLPRAEPDLHRLPDGDLIAALDERYGGIPPELRGDRALLDLFLPALRADLSIYENLPLAPIAPHPVPILALGGNDDPIVSQAEVVAWRAQTTAPFDAAFFPGGHFFLQSAFPRVLERVRGFLAQIGRNLASPR